MKTNFKLLLVIISIMMFSCNKNSSDFEKIEGDNPSPNLKSISFVPFDIPEDYKVDEEYSGTPATHEIRKTNFIYNEDTFNIIIRVLYDPESNLIVSIEATQDWVENLDLPTDMLTNNLLEDWIDLYPDDISQGAFWDALKAFFIGVQKKQNCVNGIQNIYWDHWLVGNCCWSTGPC
jgi:hypothetical protein